MPQQGQVMALQNRSQVLVAMHDVTDLKYLLEIILSIIREMSHLDCHKLFSRDIDRSLRHDAAEVWWVVGLQNHTNLNIDPRHTKHLTPAPENLRDSLLTCRYL